MDNEKIHFLFLHEFKLDHKAAEAVLNINQAWGETTTSERTAQLWFKKFRSGDISLEEKEGRGRPTALDNDQLKALVESNPRVTLQELAEDLMVDVSTVSRHLAYIGKVKKIRQVGTA